ncbi:MAG: hypothetical protein H0U55_10065 [Rubrobacteraceae bacterium]|nr:hypothetical protein [Rubrobacteraceae bacterium]
MNKSRRPYVEHAGRSGDAVGGNLARVVTFCGYERMPETADQRGDMEPNDERIVSADQLPDDPMDMPPPYWRSSGAIFCLLDAIEDIPDLLAQLVPVLERTEVELDAHFDKHGDEQTDEAMDEFADIVDELRELEGRIKAKALVAILMGAIEAEDEINRFCVYNVYKDVAESVEKLPPPDKLLVAAGTVGQEVGKGHAVYAAIKTLTQWRNAFAHGHCVDRPTKSLQHNHLIPPDQYPGLLSHLSDLRKHISSYVRVSEYLSSISINPYGAGGSVEVEHLKELLAEIARYRFTGDDTVYTVTVSDPAC